MDSVTTEPGVGPPRPGRQGATMYERTLDLLNDYFRAYNAKDVEALLGLVRADLRHDIDCRQRELGKQAFRRFLLTKTALFDEHVYDLELFINADGTRAAAEYKVLGFFLSGDHASRLPAGGRTYRVAAGTFFDVHGGLISRISSYGNRRELWGQAA